MFSSVGASVFAWGVSADFFTLSILERNVNTYNGKPKSKPKTESSCFKGPGAFNFKKLFDFTSFF